MGIDCTFKQYTKTVTAYTDCGGCEMRTKMLGLGLVSFFCRLDIGLGVQSTDDSDLAVSRNDDDAWYGDYHCPGMRDERSVPLPAHSGA